MRLGDEQAAEKFTQINRAYEVLADEEKRQIYDMQGEEEVEKFERGETQTQKGPANKVQIEVSLEEMYNGATKDYSINRNVYCGECRGSGAQGGDFKTCEVCKGAGVTMQRVNMGMMQMQMQQPCQKCGGKGKTFKKACPTCKGKRIVREPKTFNVDIVPGMANNEQLLFERQGEQVPDMTAGDLIFTLR